MRLDPIATALKSRIHEHRNESRSVFLLAIKDGVLERQRVCQECGSDDLVQGHHDDYTDPLGVRWLCRKCHGMERRGEKCHLPHDPDELDAILRELEAAFPDVQARWTNSFDEWVDAWRVLEGGQGALIAYRERDAR